MASKVPASLALTGCQPGMRFLPERRILRQVHPGIGGGCAQDGSGSLSPQGLYLAVRNRRKAAARGLEREKNA